MVRVLDTGMDAAQRNMEIDAELLENLDPNGEAILHLYEWEQPTVTYGHFFNPDTYFQKTDVVTLAKRPTGGGALFHTADYAFSLLIPSSHPGYHENVMENYAYVHTLVAKALGGDLLQEELESDAPHRFCYAKPTKYDLMVNGKKACGAAQRKKKQGYLHQGSISITLPDENLLREVLKTPDAIISAMRQNTHTLLKEGETIESRRKQIKKGLLQAITWLEQQ